MEAFGLETGMTVQELGWDTDVDDAVRQAVMDAVDADLIEDAVEAVDAVLLWWRDSDGDVADGLMDALRDLSDDGVVWLMTPKVGEADFVDPADVGEGAATAGLVLAKPVSVDGQWQAQKIVRSGRGRR
ncbi:MAG: DUF3052 domain-containing protein [Propioniciclava sp.]